LWLWRPPLERAPLGSRGGLREPWFVRPAGELGTDPPPPELEIVRVSTRAEVVEFEAASVRAFGDEGATIDSGAIHPTTILGEGRMTMLTGRVDGRPVAVAMSYRTEEAIGIYGVATIGSARRRGYGSALARAPLAPRLPPPLRPSPPGEGVYPPRRFAPGGAAR